MSQVARVEHLGWIPVSCDSDLAHFAHRSTGHGLAPLKLHFGAYPLTCFVYQLTHDDPSISYRNSLGYKPLGLTQFAPWHKSTIGCDDPPPRDLASVTTQSRPNGASSAGLADFGSDLAVRNDLTGLQRTDCVQHVGLKRCQFYISHNVQSGRWDIANQACSA